MKKALAKQVESRLREIGCQNSPPPPLMARFLTGESVMVIWKPDCGCKKCGKPKLLGVFKPATERPLEELFHP